ncbi:cystine/glutamate transporter-like isoform X2 [Solea solea]|uniref:cystine/glutamate transporter-like isoform X2 n=1 Tax=Solea solea TaxID=90069 RepID=UPI00272D01A4|nr:cystine/glutamate transporter-like isoform X2 [Solea solea]
MHRTQARTAKGGDGKEKVEEEAVQLRRKIGLLPAISLIIGSVVGSGIFVSPKGVLMNSGSVGLSLLVWALSGIISLFGALCYAELGTTFTKSGGQYTYLLELLGPVPAFLRLWGEFMFIRPAVTAYGSLAFGHYIVEPFFAPCVAPTGLIKLVGVLGVTFAIAVNSWSVTVTSCIQVFLTVVKMFAVVLIIVPGLIALGKGKTENFQNDLEPELLTLTKLPLAFYNGLYAYGGWFYLNCVTEEVINPNRQVLHFSTSFYEMHFFYISLCVLSFRIIPLAITFSMVTVTVLYVFINVAYYTVMTPAQLLMSDAVAVTFANQSIQSFVPVIPVLVAMSCLGALNGGMFGSTRLLFVAGREGHCPAIFSMIHIRRRTPLAAVLFQFPFAVAMILKGEIYQLLNVASFSRWFFIALSTLAMLIHRYRFPDLPRPFKVPVVIAVTFTAVSFFIVGLSLYSDLFNTGCSLALTLSGLPVYYVTIHRPCFPKKFTRTFNYCSKKLQILLEVAQQEVQTY